jgi:hypothetical protein
MLLIVGRFPAADIAPRPPDCRIYRDFSQISNRTGSKVRATIAGYGSSYVDVLQNAEGRIFEAGNPNQSGMRKTGVLREDFAGGGDSCLGRRECARHLPSKSGTPFQGKDLRRRAAAAERGTGRKPAYAAVAQSAACRRGPATRTECLLCRGAKSAG